MGRERGTTALEGGRSTSWKRRVRVKRRRVEVWFEERSSVGLERANDISLDLGTAIGRAGGYGTPGWASRAE